VIIHWKLYVLAHFESKWADVKVDELVGSNHSPGPVFDYDDDIHDDINTSVPQRRVPAVSTFNTRSMDDSSLVVRGIEMR